MDTISLSNGRVQMCISKLGATILTLAIDGKEILYPWIQWVGKARGGLPICAPWFGSSPRGKKKHGHLRDLRAAGFSSIGTEQASFLFHHRGDESYPWSLDYFVRFVLVEKGLTMTLKVERMKDGITATAPILPAFHPYFSCSDANRVAVWTDRLDHYGFSNEARAVRLLSETVVIETPERIIEMKLGGSFFPERSELVLWTDSPGHYFCVEPIIENQSLFDSPGGRTLLPGQSLQLSMSLKVR